MKNLANRFALALACCTTAVATQGQQIQGIKLNPGERLVAINGVPVGDYVQQAAYLPQQAARPPAATSKTAAPASAQAAHGNIIGTLTRSNLSFSHTPGATALEKANAERRRYGQGPLLPDPQLQALALRKATIAAQRGYKNHIGGSLGSAQCEGVGHTNGRFLTCCLDERGTYGGAAMVQGADGWYCCLLVR